MELEFIRNRITQLRLTMGVSEHRMSVELGHSRNYIRNITSGRSLPSVPELLYICEYLNVQGMRELPDKDLLTLISLIDRLKES